jgi:PST family polysaccharide transporter
MTESGVQDGRGLRSRVVHGALLLGCQRALNIAVAALGGIVLARLFLPELFGTFAFILFVASLGILAGDLGLGTALIQRERIEPAASLEAAFLLQLGIAALVAGLMVIAAPLCVRSFGLAPEGVDPLRVLAILVPLAALRMPPLVMLERGLRYGPIVLADTLDTLVFHAVAIGAGLAGMGLWSFVLGMIAGKVVAAMLLWRAAAWRPSWVWNGAAVKGLMKEGLPLQGTAALVTAREGALPVLVVLAGGAAAVGALNLAMSLSSFPLQVVISAGRVLRPALSRIRHDAAAFAAATERAMNGIAVMLCPLLLMMAVGADPIVRYVYGTAWLPAVPALRWLSAGALMGGLTTVLVYALHGLGRSDVVMRFNVLWTALLWGLAVVCIHQWGPIGFAMAHVCMAASGALVYVAVRRTVPIRVVAQVGQPLLAGGVAAGLFGLLAQELVAGPVSLMLAAGAALLVYGLALWMLCGTAWRNELMADWGRLWSRDVAVGEQAKGLGLGEPRT